MIRIGHISYANCTPIFDAMPGHTGFSFEQGVPADLNTLLAEGKLDLCPSSSFEYAVHHESYLIVPDLSISSFGTVQSVLFFSSVPVSELNGSRILLTSESATSVNLLKVLLEKKYGVFCDYSTADFTREYQPATGIPTLLIGDSAIRAAMQPYVHHIYDLGEEWFQWTGLPFTFGLWLARRDVVVSKRTEIERAVRCFHSSKHSAYSSLGQIAEKAHESSWMGKERLVEYWGHISYDLTPAHIRGLELFFGLCAECGLIGNAPPLHFLEMSK